MRTVSPWWTCPAIQASGGIRRLTGHREALDIGARPGSRRCL